MRAERSERGRAVSRMNKLLFCSLAGLVVAMGVGAAAVSQSAAPIVKIDSGELQGVVADGVVSFKGIPFAAPPVGELRWRPPQPLNKWTGVRQASEFGAKFDMEADALSIAVLGVVLAAGGRLGIWILIPGLLRYVYVIAIGLVETHGDAPRSRFGRYVFALQAVSLVVALWPTTPPYGGVRTLAMRTDRSRPGTERSADCPHLVLERRPRVVACGSLADAVARALSRHGHAASDRPRMGSSSAFVPDRRRRRGRFAA